tara:strand:+ start:141 stop:347 length:207 start_codon:yes stop_codon:yes gene_type:complete
MESTEEVKKLWTGEKKKLTTDSKNKLLFSYRMLTVISIKEKITTPARKLKRYLFRGRLYGTGLNSYLF